MPLRRRTLWASAALLVTACTSAPSTGEAPTPVASAPDEADGTIDITGLAIDQPSWEADGDDWLLVLTWEAPGAVAVDHYEVRRNGVTVDRDVGETVFPDSDVEPGARYRYVVVGVAPGGSTIAAAEASIRTDEPELAEARLEGRFVVHMRVTESSGTGDPVRGGAIGFTFEPTCTSGPCSVRWSVQQARAEGSLRRRDAVYTASLRTPLFIRNCFDAVVDESLDVRLRVTRAAALDDQWRATKIAGSIEEISSYRGCVTASIDWDVRGSLQS
ncbi:MAG TPA: hypothetical protein VG993_01210 [Actinomycetota bacterium]|nr:hypothetical protein [Actinomycetota bacterium]